MACSCPRVVKVVWLAALSKWGCGGGVVSPVDYVLDEVVFLVVCLDGIESGLLFGC